MGRVLRYLDEVHGGAEVVAVVGQRQLHRLTDRLQPREVDHEVEPVLTTRSDIYPVYMWYSANLQYTCWYKSNKYLGERSSSVHVLVQQ